MAEEGMAKCSEVASSCAMTVPPHALTAWTPSVASRSPPVRTTAMTSPRKASAAEENSGLADERTCRILQTVREGQRPVGLHYQMTIRRGHVDRAGPHPLRRFSYFDLEPLYAAQHLRQ